MVGMVNVMVGVSVAGRVTSRVSGTALGVPSVVVTVIVPSAVTDVVGVRGVEVLEGRAVFVEVGVRLEVGEGSADGSCVGVDVAAGASTIGGKPDPIKLNMIPAKIRNVIPLKMIPPIEGRSLKA